MDIGESARRLAAIRWVESTLFAVLGASAQRCPTPSVKVMVATHARHAAWRADQVAARLPEAGPFAIDVVGVAPAGGDELRAHLDALEELELVSAVSRVVVPRLVGATRLALDRCDGPADDSVARTLQIVLDDQLADWADAQVVLATLVVDADAATAATSAAGAAESAWLRTGLVTE